MSGDVVVKLRDWLKDAHRVYSDRRVIAILLLGFSSGLPIMLVATTLSTWLREEGLSRGEIGLFGFIFVPYTLKFIWAPLIDRMPLPPFTTLLGRRRGWMLVTQICLVGAIWGLGQTEPGVDLWWTAFMAVVVAFFSASQDVVIDAFRIDSLPQKELGAGAANAVLGYRVAMWIATAGALFIAEWYGWSSAYLAMALLMLVGIGTTFFVREPEGSNTELVDDTVLEEDNLVRSMPADVIASYRRIAGTFAFVLFWLLLLEPVSLVFGLLSPFHGPWTLESGDISVQQVAATLGAVVLTAIGIWNGWLLFERRGSASYLAKNFAMASLLWLLVELALYAIPASGGFVGEVYAWLFVAACWLVSSKVVALFGIAWAYGDVVTPTTVMIAGLWIKFLFFVFFYGFFYFSRYALANFGITSIDEETKLHLWTRRAVVGPYYDFFRAHGIKIAIIILLLISVFKSSDAILQLLANPFYIDVGFGKDQIAAISKTFGLWMTLLGSAAAGVLLFRVGMMRAMVIATIVMSLSNLMFAVVAHFGADALVITNQALSTGRELTEAEMAARGEIGTDLMPLFTLLIIIENISGGLGTTIFVAFLSSLCNVNYSATQYAMLSSFMQMFAKFIVIPVSGFYADAVGWSWFFISSTLFALPALFLLWLLSREGISLADQSGNSSAGEG
ncbi:MAG: MFS transporter [Geminicoccaceae bacterium]